MPNDDSSLDRNALQRAELLFEFLRDRYWRVEVQGDRRIRTQGLCLFVANRSGLLPHDGLMLVRGLDGLANGSCRVWFMVENEVNRQPFMQAVPFGLQLEEPTRSRTGGLRSGTRAFTFGCLLR